MRVFVAVVSLALVALGCDSAPPTYVVLDNRYPASATSAPVVYRAYWQAVAFPSPVAPGTASDPQSTVPASENTAYVVLAPGWDPTSATTPTSFVVLQSSKGFEAHLGDTVHIPVDDTTFVGNCAAGSHLTQGQADFITTLVFPADFGTYTYDAATCAVTRVADAGAGD